jgi:hypothetical protein
MSLHIINALAGTLLVITPSFVAADIQPGLWELVVESRIVASPESPPDYIAMEQCFTRRDALDPSRVFGSMANMGATDCTYPEKSNSGNVFHFKMKCAGSHGIQASGEIAYSESSMDGSIVTTVTIEGQQTELQSRIRAHRLGGC